MPRDAADPAILPHSPRAAAGLALREALGAPAVVLAASFVGFGALMRSSDMTLAMALTSTVTTWALPGQIVMVEMLLGGATLFAIALAVSLTNVRLMPMVVSLLPVLRRPETPRWQLFAAAHMIAVTGWVQAMARCPSLPADQRLAYLFGFTLTIYAASILATGAGWVLAGQVPVSVSLGLVILNPIYFMLVTTGSIESRVRLYAVAFGAVLGPTLHWIDPNTGLLLTGLIGGTAAYLLDRWLPRPAVADPPPPTRPGGDDGA